MAASVPSSLPFTSLVGWRTPSVLCHHLPPLHPTPTPTPTPSTFCTPQLRHTSQLCSHTTRVALSNDIMSYEIDQEQSPHAHRWTDDYIAAPATVYNRDDAHPVEDGDGTFLLPLMLLQKIKLPTETVQLQIFEPRYRLMFRVVGAQSRSRCFGVVLSDPTLGLIERTGTLCQLTHFIPVPERRRIFVSARAIGRFQVESVVSGRPFVAAKCRRIADDAPSDLAEEAEAAAAEARVWEAMQDVRRLASKLFARDGSGLGDDAFGLEIRRYSPDESVRRAVEVAAGSDPALLQAAEMAGLLGNTGLGGSGAPLGQRPGAHVHICSDALKELSEAERRERFSFALLRQADTDHEARLKALLGRNTVERLKIAEEQFLEGRAYLAARSALKDISS